MNARVRRLFAKARTLTTWLADAKDFRRILDEAEAPPARGPGSVHTRVLVYVEPWLLSPVPWYAALIGTLLARREGVEVEFLFDDMRFADDFRERLELRYLAFASKTLAEKYRVYLTSQMEPSPDGRQDRGESLPFLCAKTLILRSDNSDLALGNAGPLRARLRDRIARVEHALDKSGATMFLMGGGGARTSGAAQVAARNKGVRIVSFDSGFGTILCCVNGIAATLEDLPSVFRILLARERDERAFGIALAREELEKRIEAKDALNSQAARSTGKRYEFDVLICLNQSIDLTAIGRHSVFADQHVWIARTVEYVSQRTQGSIAVRRHPVERFADQRSKDDYESVVNVAARGSKRVRYIREDEDVNTYDLLRSAKVCVTYLSTVGLESTMLGVPTITVGHATYAGLGIVREPRDEQEYLDAIADALEGRMVVTQMQKEFASLMYYLTQVCNYCWSDFLPCPPFQNRWKSRSWKSFIGEPDVETIFTCALSGTPFALVEHERRFAAAKAGETRNL